MESKKSKLYTPIISVIIPIYNAEKCLHRCINSIINQTFYNIEIILIDDGSPDHCSDICDEYSKIDARIKVIHKQNAGVSSARNTGLNHALGEYIMFCDADDYVAPNWCEILYNQILNTPNAWIVSNIATVRDNKIFITQNRLNSDFKLSYHDIFASSLSAYTVNKIYNKSILFENNIFFDESRKIGEDVLFNINYYLHCDSIIYLKEPLYYYCLNSQSASNKYQPNQFELNLELFSARLKVIQKNELEPFTNLYLYMFLRWLNNTMDKRNPMSFIQKMRYNNKMMNTEEFRFCVSHATGNNDSKLFMKIVKKHNYYLYWLFQKACVIKGKLFNRNTGEKQ